MHRRGMTFKLQNRADMMNLSVPFPDPKDIQCTVSARLLSTAASASSEKSDGCRDCYRIPTLAPAPSSPISSRLEYSSSKRYATAAVLRPTFFQTSSSSLCRHGHRNPMEPQVGSKEDGPFKLFRSSSSLAVRTHMYTHGPGLQGSEPENRRGFSEAVQVLSPGTSQQWSLFRRHGRSA